MAEILVGRQPIFNRNMEVYAYELLYRSDQTNQAKIQNGDQATINVILNTLVEMGLDTITGHSLAFINLTRNFIVGKYPIPLPTNRVVIEILEDVNFDEELLTAVRDLSQSGFTIALDDVVTIDRVSSFNGFSSIVKLDLPQIDRLELPEIVNSIKKKGLRVLAEKVETQADYNMCRRLGVDYYQGYFLCKPNIIKGNKMDTSRLVVMQSLAMLQDQKTSFNDLEGIIARDVGLSYKLLRLTNSGYYSFATEVKSLRQAISLIGFNTMRGWMSLILMTTLHDKPPELTNIALTRAHMAESLARLYGQAQPELFFLVGLFSVLDALMDQPMTDLVTQLNLSDEVTNALVKYEGLPGFVLYNIKAYENGDWENVKRLNVPDEQLTQIYLDSIKWTNILSEDLHASISAMAG